MASYFLLLFNTQLSCISLRVHEQSQIDLLNKNFLTSIRSAQSATNRTGLTIKANLDANTVPHLAAANEEDLYFAQGFTHAYFRLWQMETIARLIEGSLAELIGERGVSLDRSSFQFGYDEIAKQATQRLRLNERSRKIVEAYVAGINARSDQLSESQLPLEYRKLGIRPRRFSALDVIRISYARGFILTDPYAELRLSRTHAKLAPELFNTLFPWPPEREEQAQLFGPTTAKMPRLPKAKVAISLDEIPRDSLINTWVRSRPDTGSNAWVIGVNQSSDGKPIIANDYHNHYHLPGLYIPMVLSLDGKQFVGVTIPGQPGISAGTNGKVGFGYVASLVDIADWYRLKTDPKDPNKYLWNGKYLTFETVKKTIGVRGGSPIKIEKRISRAGPMIPALRNQQGVVTELAYRWAGRVPTKAILSSLELPLFESAEQCGNPDFIDSLMGLVFTCVDTAGRQGVWVTGPIPRRKDGIEPRILNEATSDKDVWHGLIETKRNPSIFPVKEFTPLGNQKIMSNNGAYYLGWNFSPPIRAIRMNTIFSGRKNIELEDVVRGQADIEDARTAAVRGSLLELTRRNQNLNQCESQTVSEIASWNGEFERDSYRARLFNRWLESIHAKLWQSAIGEESTFQWPTRWRTIELILEPNESSIWKVYGGRQRFVSSVLNEICRVTFANDVNKLKTYQWQLASRPTFKSVSGEIPKELEKLRVAGSTFSLFSQSGDHGTVFRWVAKVADPPDFRFSAIGGIDGDPSSPWSTNWSVDWSNRELYNVNAPKGDSYD